MLGDRKYSHMNRLAGMKEVRGLGVGGGAGRPQILPHGLNGASGM